MGPLRTHSTLLAVLLVGVLGAAGVARGAVIGANEDETKTRTALYGQIAEVGLRQNVLSVTWTQGQGLSGAVQGVIRSAIQSASAQGVATVLAVYPAPGNAAKFGDPANKPEFVTFVGNVVRSFPEVRSVIVGNEPNRTLFMSPVNPALFAEILGDAYDTIKAVNPAIKVLGVGLSPRGTGDGKSQFPPQFVKRMGDWYRASERAKQGLPLMDTFSFHPYPFPEDKSPTTTSDWPVVGIPDLYRLKQAIWDAFQGTPQKTVEDGLLLDLDEVAYQVPTDGKGGYTGSETVKTVSEATQADYYAQIVKLVACDPQVGSLSFFHFIDEADRARFQSGFLDVSSGRRPVADAVKQALVETAGGSKCTGTPVAWVHSTGVLGATPDLSKLKTSYPKTVSSFTVGLRVEEDAAVQVALFKLAGPAATDADRAAIERTLAARGAGAADPVQVATVSRAIPAAPMAKPDYSATLELKLARALDDGVYVLALVTKSALNPARLTRATSPAFTVGTPAVTPPSSGGGAKAPADAALITYSDFYDPASIGPSTAMYLTLRASRPVDYTVVIKPVVCTGAAWVSTYYSLKGGSLKADITTRINFTLPATFKAGVWRVTATVRDASGVTQSVQSKGYVALGVPGPDKVVPDLTVIDAAEAVPAAGDGIPLRYELCESSGEVATDLTVRAGTKTGAVVAKLTTPQTLSAPFRRYLVSWKPKGLPINYRLV
jgi:hypothetical protein